MFVEMGMCSVLPCSEGLYCPSLAPGYGLSLFMTSMEFFSRVTGMPSYQTHQLLSVTEEMMCEFPKSYESSDLELHLSPKCECQSGND